MQVIVQIERFCKVGATSQQFIKIPMSLLERVINVSDKDQFLDIK